MGSINFVVHLMVAFIINNLEMNCVHSVCACMCFANCPKTLSPLYVQLPVFAKSLGKRVFKRHLEPFLDAIFYGLVRQECCCTILLLTHVTAACYLYRVHYAALI